MEAYVIHSRLFTAFRKGPIQCSCNGPINICYDYFLKRANLNLVQKYLSIYIAFYVYNVLMCLISNRLFFSSLSLYTYA